MANWQVVSKTVGAYTAKVLGKKAPRADVEDVRSEAIKRAFEALGENDTEAVIQEALRCVRNLASSRRRVRRKGRLIFVPRTPAWFGQEPPDIAKELDRAAMIATLRAALADDDEAQAVIEAALGGAGTREEIAEATGLTKVGVRNAQRRIYRRGRELFGAS